MMDQTVAQTLFSWLSDFGPYLAMLGQALVLSRYLDTRNRDYPLAILFSFVLFLVTVIGVVVPFFQLFPQLEFLPFYTTLDLTMHILLLALMLQLLQRTLRSLDSSTSITLPLAILSCVVAATAYFCFGLGGQREYVRVFRTRQVVSFWLVLINLYWWTLLLRRRQLDRRILLLSAGIGLMMTGQVISDGVNTLYKNNIPLKLTGGLVMYATHFACLYTWFNAFRPNNALQGKPSLT